MRCGKRRLKQEGGKGDYSLILLRGVGTFMTVHFHGGREKAG